MTFDSRKILLSAMFAGAVALGTILAVPITANAQGDAVKIPPATAVHDDEVAIKVSGQDITLSFFEAVVQERIPKRFFHGKIPEGGEETLRFEVANELALRKLQAKAADDMNIAIDDDAVEAQLAAMELRYRGNKVWEQRRDTVLPRLRRDLVEQEKINWLQVEVTKSAETDMTDEIVEAFYDKNSDLFVQPQQDRVRFLLLGVDPGTDQAGWEAAQNEAEKIHKHILDGKDFGKLAKLHSSHVSASDGGDMGYQHRGVFEDRAYTIIDEMEIGNVSEPFRILQGYAIIKLEGRLPSRKLPLAKVKARAFDLAKRDFIDRLWNDFGASLMTKASVTYHRSILLPYLEWLAKDKARKEEEAKKATDEATKKTGEAEPKK